MLTRIRLVAFSVLAAAGSAWAAGPRTWKAGGVTFELTPSELRAWTGAPSGPPAFSTAALLAAEKKEFDAYAQELARGLAGPDAPTYADYTFAQSVTLEVLSVVGPLVSLRESGGGDTPGAAHPSGYEVLRTHDVLRKDATPSLLAFYSEKEIVAALKADPFVRKFGNPEKGFARAASLKDLVDSLDRDWAQENSEAPENDCGFEVSFDTSMVEQFYFHHLEKDRAAVRIALAPGNEWCNRLGGRQELGLLLPIPDALRSRVVGGEGATMPRCHGSPQHDPSFRHPAGVPAFRHASQGSGAIAATGSGTSTAADD